MIVTVYAVALRKYSATGHGDFMFPGFKVQEVEVILKHQITGAKGRTRRLGSVKSTNCRQRRFALKFRVPWSKGGQSWTTDHEQSHYDAIHDLVALILVVDRGIGGFLYKSKLPSTCN